MFFACRLKCAKLSIPMTSLKKYTSKLTENYIFLKIKAWKISYKIIYGPERIDFLWGNFKKVWLFGYFKEGLKLIKTTPSQMNVSKVNSFGGESAIFTVLINKNFVFLESWRSGEDVRLSPLDSRFESSSRRHETHISHSFRDFGLHWASILAETTT